MTVNELRKRFGYLLITSTDWVLEELLAMNKEQLLAEFDHIKAAEEKLNETDFLLEKVGWTRSDLTNKRKRVYTHLHYEHFRQTVMDEKRNNSGERRYNAAPNTTIYLQDLADMISCIYYDKYGYDSEFGKINDKYTKKFHEFYEKEYMALEEPFTEF